jgi:hypothetical protein
LRQDANIVVKAEYVQVCAIRRPPAAGGPPPPFIGQGEAVYNRAAQF